MAIFRCDLESLAPHIARLGRGVGLHELKDKCVQAINSHARGYSRELERALASDDFQVI
jgi:hypothetical protein